MKLTEKKIKEALTKAFISGYESPSELVGQEVDRIFKEYAKSEIIETKDNQETLTKTMQAIADVFKKQQSFVKSAD